MDPSLLAVFIPTFIFVSITPGMCMLLSMTLGISIGVKKTQWMMVGELLGVSTTSVLSVMFVGAVLLHYPQVFIILKCIGAAYLAYLGLSLWRSKGAMAIQEHHTGHVISPLSLVSLGFFTAVANPKGWAFFIALLPPFLDPTQPLFFQLFCLVAIILTIELSCLYLYAAGGKLLRSFLQKSDKVRWINRVSGSLMLGVALWLFIA